MAYQRGSRWYSRPTILGVRYGPFALGTRDKRTAHAVEQTLLDLPLTCPALLPHLASGRVSPVEIRAAALQHGLAELAQRLEMRPLSVVVAELLRSTRQARVIDGGEMLERLVADERGERGEGGEATVNWLRDPRNVRAVLYRREREGVKRNTVIRTVKGFVSALLRHEGVDPEPIMRRVAYTPEKDRRNVPLSPEQIHAMLNACVEPDYRDIVTLAVTTAMDLAPICRIQPEDFRDPMLKVRDYKAKDRDRSIELGPVAQVALRTAIARNNTPFGQPVFRYTQHQCWERWVVVRERANLPRSKDGSPMRFKDLRGVAATYLAASGTAPKDLMQIMGHSNPNQSIAYTSAVQSGDAMSAAEKLMGLRRLA